MSPPSVKFEVLLFASLRDRAGEPTISVEVSSPSTIASLREALSSTYPDLAPGLRASRVAVDNEFQEDSYVIAAGSEVAVIPPVSGG